MNERSGQTGFSLIEVVIVTLIVGILASIAYPSYQQYMQKTNRQTGKECLTRLANKQEVYYTRFNRYATSLDELGEENMRCAERGSKRSDDLYRISIGNSSKNCDSKNCYRIFANAKHGQANDGNLRLIVNRTKDGITSRAGQRQKRQERNAEDGWEPWDNN